MRLILKPGVTPILDDLGRSMGALGDNPDAPGGSVDLDIQTDPETGVIAITPTIPGGGQAVLVGAEFAIAASHGLISRHVRSQLTRSATATRIQVRAAVLVGGVTGRLGPAKYIPLPPYVAPVPVVVTANPSLVSTGRIGDPVAQTDMVYTGGERARFEAYAESQFGAGAISSELRTWAQVPSLAVGTEIWTRQRVMDMTLNGGAGAWVERASNRIAITAAPVITAPVPGTDVVWAAPRWFPETQSVTFGVAVTLPGATGAIPDLWQWTAGDTTSGTAPAHKFQLRSGTADVYEMRANNDPVPTGSFDAGKLTVTDPRRDAIQFRRRESITGEWSAWSGVMSTAPAPITDPLPPRVFDIVVNSEAGLKSAWESYAGQSGNRRIGVAPGNYGNFNWFNGAIRKADGRVTIASQDPANPATFNTFKIGPSSFNAVQTGNGFRGFEIEDLNINCTDVDANGFGTGNAAVLAWSEDFAVRRCRFYGSNDQLILSSSRRGLIEYNILLRATFDGVRIYQGVRDLTFQHNRWRDWNTDRSRSTLSSPNPHPDLMQAALQDDANTNNETGHVQPRNVKLLYNHMTGINHYLQHYYSGNQKVRAGKSLEDWGFKGFEFRGNYIEGATLHGISCYETVEQYLRGNKIAPLEIPPGEVLYARPTITIGRSNARGTIMNNVTSQGIFLDGGRLSDFTVSGNSVAFDRTTEPPREAYGVGWIGFPASGPTAWGRTVA